MARWYRLRDDLRLPLKLPQDGLPRALSAARSAFGGVLICNSPIDKATAEAMHELFFEVAIAPAYDTDALEVLKQKKNRILLVQKPCSTPNVTVRSALNGYLVQSPDAKWKAQQT